MNRYFFDIACILGAIAFTFLSLRVFFSVIARTYPENAGSNSSPFTKGGYRGINSHCDPALIC